MNNSVIILNKSSYPDAKFNDENVKLYFYDVDTDAFTYGLTDDTTHIFKIDADATAQDIDNILDDIFFDHLIKYGKVG